MSPPGFSRLLRRAVSMFAASTLLLFVLNASATDTCEASFTHGGNAATGLTFAASRTVPGLASNEALTQYKQIAQNQGFQIQHEAVGRKGATLTVNQLPSSTARGFDLHMQADDTGKVSISTTLPPGMTAAPEAFRDNMCTALNQLEVGAVIRQTSNADAQPPLWNPTAQETTDTCMANFSRDGITGEGETYSTWTLGSSINIPAAIEKLKAFTSQLSVLHLMGQEIYGNKATLLIRMDDVSLVFYDAFDRDPDVRGFTLRLDLDTAIDAVSLSARANKEQQTVDKDRMRRLACMLVAIAADGVPPPDEKKPSRIHNPFKNEQKAAQQQLDSKVQHVMQARAELYQRAHRAGKAIVFVPMVNVASKYAGTDAKERISGGSIYKSTHFDRTTTFIWQAVGEPKDIFKVGDEMSLRREGLFGYIQSELANKTMYGVYIVTPGRYELVRLSYELADSSLPELDSKRWVESPKLGMASFAITRNAQLKSHEAWAGPEFENVKVYNGTSCPYVVGGMCAGGSAQYRTEAQMTKAAGWREVVDKSYAGGLATTVTLTKPFAQLEVKPGAIIVTDGFSAIQDSVAYDSAACKQAGDKLVNCAINSLKLFRIPGRTNEIQLTAESAAKVPVIAGFITQATYQPMTINATKLAEKPGTYEAAWATPYSVSGQ